MTIPEYQIMHGAVLSRICRNDRPMTLRMIETSNESRAAYIINDALYLYMKHSRSPAELKREDALRWQYTFTPANLAELRRLMTDRPVYLALICGYPDLRPLDVCLLEPEEIPAVIDVTAEAIQSIQVKLINGARKLRVNGSARSREMLVPRNLLDTWEIG